MDIEALKIAFLIFLIRFVGMTMAGLRTIFMVKGYKLWTFVISFFETIIYIYGLSLVLSHLDNLVNIIVYALGFALGNYFAIFIEEKVGIGVETFIVVPSTGGIDLAFKLRKEGYVLTELDGKGYHGDKKVLYVTMPKKNTKKFEKLLKKEDPKAYYLTLETKRIKKNNNNIIRA